MNSSKKDLSPKNGASSIYKNEFKDWTNTRRPSRGENNSTRSLSKNYKREQDTDESPIVGADREDNFSNAISKIGRGGKAYNESSGSGSRAASYSKRMPSSNNTSA